MNRKLWENMASLYGVQVLNYAVPLFTLPYLTRVLGTGPWGVLAFADAYASYISLVVEYGFGLSATREIAQLRDDGEARSRQFAGVLGAQVILAAIASVFTLFLSGMAPSLATYRPLLPYALLLAVSRSLVPFWYFQGLERMRLVAMLNVTANVIAAAAILICVQHPADIWMPLAFRAGASLLSFIAALGIVYSELPVLMPAWRYSWLVLRQGGSLFLFKSAVSLYTTANVLLLGFIAAPAVVAWFAGAEKIAKAAVGTIGPITQAFYPRIAHLMANDEAEATRTARLSAWITVGAGAAAGIVLFGAAPWLVRALLGRGFENSIPVLRLFSVLPPLIAGSNVLGIQWMLPLRLDKEFNMIILIAGAFNLALALLLTPRFQQIGMAVSVALAETLVTASMVLLLRRRRLDPWSARPQVKGIAA
jgi:PST family polysaccharide transporter